MNRYEATFIERAIRSARGYCPDHNELASIWWFTDEVFALKCEVANCDWYLSFPDGWLEVEDDDDDGVLIYEAWI